MKFISKLIFNMMVRLHFLAAVFMASNLFASQDFTLGAKHYEAKEYTEAAESFKRAAAKTPSTDVFLNLGLSEFQLAHYGWALAYWRRALDLSPWNSSAKEAIEHLASLNKLRRTSEDVSLLQRVHQSLLKYIPINLLLSLSLACMIAGFWNLISFLGQRRRSILTGELVPDFPIKVGVKLGMFILLILISALKYYDNKTLRVTVIVQSTPLRTGPTDESASVMEIFEGQELVVQRLDKDKEWLQVTYAGKTTGWIESKAAAVSSGEGA